jgi:hypothetical protein
MSVIPSIIIYKSSPIGEACDLITIIPPTHDDRLWLGIHSQPIIGFPIVIDNVFLAIVNR